MFNLPSNVEVLMEVSPDSSMDLNSSDDQSPNNGANNNNNAGELFYTYIFYISKEISSCLPR